MTSIGNEAPVEVRLADLGSEIEDEKVEASLYRLKGEETHQAARTTFVSYEYLRDIESRIGLVDHWIMRGGE